MNVVVFGADGPTGRLVTQLALAQEHAVTAVTPAPDLFPFSHPASRSCQVMSSTATRP